MGKVEKIAIIAGEGSLPHHVYEKCIDDNKECIVICIEGHANAEGFGGAQVVQLPIHAVTKILSVIKKFGATKVVLAGKVKRIKLSRLLFDIKGAQLFTKIMRNGMADDSLLRSIITFLEMEGLKVIPADAIVTDMFAEKGVLTSTKPKSHELDEIVKGKKILRDISKHDMGQALIIQAGLILGVEAAEGTDELIHRCGAIQQKINERPILIKMMKVSQDKKVDVPCIGKDTIRNLHEASIRGVAIEAKKTYILDKKETIKLANDLKIFIYGF